HRPGGTLSRSRRRKNRATANSAAISAHSTPFGSPESRVQSPEPASDDSELGTLDSGLPERADRSHTTKAAAKRANEARYRSQEPVFTTQLCTVASASASVAMLRV